MPAAIGAGFLLFIAGFCGAAERSADSPVQALMRASGLDQQINQVPFLLQAGIQQQYRNSRDLSANELSYVLTMARDAFDPDTIKDQVAAQIASDLSERAIQQALSWLESPLGRRITSLEERASTPEAHAEMESMAPDLAREYRGSSRFAKISRLDKATLASERSTNMVLDVQLAMMTAFSAVSEEPNRPTYDDLVELVREMRPQIRDAMTHAVALEFLYSYRTLTESEIDRYIVFAESDAGIRYHRATYNGLHYAIVQAAKKMGTRMGLRMKNI